MRELTAAHLEPIHTGGAAEKNVFHLVDLPGVGYAEVPTFKREEWKQFYRDYLSQRQSLRVLFQVLFPPVFFAWGGAMSSCDTMVSALAVSMCVFACCFCAC